MASVVASSAVISPAAFAAATPAVKAGYAGLKPSGLFTSAKGLEWSQKTVGNGSRVNCMQVWEPFNNKKYETLSYLPPLSSEGISKEIDYMISKGWFPCLEFCDIGYIYREHFQGSGYYDGRYWTMWKLPMFGCQDSAAVLREIEECKKAYPKCFVRVLGFDNKRQVQCAGFIVYNPESS